MPVTTYIGPAAFEVIPALWVFGAWVVFTVAFYANGIATCAGNSGPLAQGPESNSMFRSQLEGESKFRETYKARFGKNEIFYVALLNGAAGLLLWLADGGRFWAAGMLAVMSLWLVYSHATSPFTLRQMNPRLLGTIDWVYYLTGALVWAYLTGCVVQRWAVKL